MFGSLGTQTSKWWQIQGFLVVLLNSGHVWESVSSSLDLLDSSLHQTFQFYPGRCRLALNGFLFEVKTELTLKVSKRVYAHKDSMEAVPNYFQVYP